MPAPPRIAVLPSPNTSYANPKRGPISTAGPLSTLSLTKFMPWNGVPVPGAKVPIFTDGNVCPVTGLRATRLAPEHGLAVRQYGVINAGCFDASYAAGSK